MTANTQMIETLTNSPVYQEYEQAYTEATGLPVALRPTETWRLPLHGKRNESPFCAMMANTSRTCAACLQTQECLARSATSQPCTMTCAYGLSETAVPVKLGAETIGYLQTGQVMRRRPTEASFERAVEAAKKLGVDINNETARQAFFKTPVVSERKLDSMSRLLAIFAEHLSMKSNQIAVQSANSEPPVITKAKQFIAEHHSDDLCLAHVAKAVHMSTFYLCKLFRRSGGVTFTEFVSRTRVEKAKNLLLNPNLRISEIAFEVGFQSLTHFNRIFKKIVGESPTDYREHLRVV